MDFGSSDMDAVHSKLHTISGNLPHHHHRHRHPTARQWPAMAKQVSVARSHVCGDSLLGFGSRRHLLFGVRAADATAPPANGAKKSKPPFKPANRKTIIASIVVPLLLAAGAALSGQLLVRRLERQAMEEAENLARRLDPARLLPEGRSGKESSTDKPECSESEAVVSTRNRPKREE